MRWLLLLLPLWLGCSSSRTTTRAADDASSPWGTRADDACPACSSAFAEAEAKRDRAQSIRTPAFEGARTRAGILAFLKGPVATWLKQRQAAVSEAERQYREVVRLSSGSSPVLALRGLTAIGEMHDRYAAEFIEAIIMPEDFDDDPDRRAAFAAAASEGASMSEMRARAAFEECAALGRSSGAAASAYEPCRAWLRDHPAP